MIGQSGSMDEGKIFSAIEEQCKFKIEECRSPSPGDFKKLELTQQQQMQVSELMKHIPIAAAAQAMAGAYTVRFPKGLPHTLISLKQGGLGSQIVDDGKIVGSASFYRMDYQAAALGLFTVMSVATGQFFMAQINKELKRINEKIDNILRFLYGDKSAELLSELNFVQYAYDAYRSIMASDAHRAATISSLQQAGKVAVKDIEFYLNDLDAKVNDYAKFKHGKELNEEINKNIFPIEESLRLSLQLYIMSSLLEVYYAQNFDRDYLSYFEKRTNEYIETCNDKMFKRFGTLTGHIEMLNKKQLPELTDTKRMLGELEKSLKNEYTEIRKKLGDAFSHINADNSEYRIEANGGSYDVYCRA